MDKQVDLSDILKDVVKGDNVYWSGAFCYYKHYEIVTVFGRDKITTVWVRQSMPDDRSNRWLKPEDPDFFTKLEVAVSHAKKVVDDTEKTKYALDRSSAYTKPMAGPVA